MSYVLMHAVGIPYVCACVRVRARARMVVWECLCARVWHLMCMRWGARWKKWELGREKREEQIGGPEGDGQGDTATTIYPPNIISGRVYVYIIMYVPYCQY